MPQLAGRFDLTENPQVDLQLAQQLGGTVGQFFGIREAEKRNQELDAMVVQTLSRAAGENWPATRTLQELRNIPNLHRSRVAQMVQEQAIKQQFEAQDPYRQAQIKAMEALATQRTTPKPEKPPTVNQQMWDLMTDEERRQAAITQYQTMPQAKVAGMGMATDLKKMQIESIRLKNEAMVNPDSPENQLKIKRAELLDAQIEKTNLQNDIAADPESLDNQYKQKRIEVLDSVIKRNAQTDYDRFIAAGLSPDEAKAAVRVKAGLLPRAKDTTFDYDKAYKSAYGAYINATGKDVFGNPNTDPKDYVDPEGVEIAKERLRKIREKQQAESAVPTIPLPEGVAGPPAPVTTKPSATAPSIPPTQAATVPTTQIPAPKSKAEYDALPPGTQYRHIDGQLKIKGKITPAIPEPNVVKANLEANLGSDIDFSKPPPKQKKGKGFIPRDQYEALAAKYGLVANKGEIILGVKQSVPDIEGIPYYKLWMGTARIEDFTEAARLLAADKAREQTDLLNYRQPWQPPRL